MKKYLFLMLGIVAFMSVSCVNTNSNAKTELSDSTKIDSVMVDSTTVISDSIVMDSVK